MLFLILISTMIVGIVLRGWVLSTLWGWFLVPLGAVEIGIAAALGISIIIGMFTTHLTHDTVKVKLNDQRTLPDLFATIVSKSIGGPLISLLFGWIILLFT